MVTVGMVGKGWIAKLGGSAVRTAFGRNDAELLPRMSRVAVLWNAANPYPALVFKETERAAQTLGIEVQSLEVQEPNDFGNAFEAAERHQPDALTAKSGAA